MAFFQNIYDKHANFGKTGMQMPGLASASNFLGNMKAGFKLGFSGDASGYRNPGNGGLRGTPFNFTSFGDSDENGIHRNKTAWNPQLSIGGLASAGYGAVGGAAVGAGAGAALSSFVEGGNMATGAAIGAVAGGIGLAVAPIAVGAAAKGAYDLATKVPDVLAGIGTATGKALSSVGKFAKGGLLSAMNGLEFSAAEMTSMGASGLTKAAIGANPLTRYTKAAAGFASKLVKFQEGASETTASFLHDYKFTGLGLATLATGKLVKGTKDAFNTLMEESIGQRDSYITSVAPQIRLMDDAGATGDLVFALNNNRRG